MIIIGLLVGVVVLIGLGVSALGLLVVWGGAGNLWHRWAAFVGALRSRGWAETQGTVTRSVVAHRRHRRGIFYSPAIRYSYGVDGKRWVGERVDFDAIDGEDGSLEGAQAVVERVPVGSTQRVYYDPAAPRRATLARTVPPIVLPTVAWAIVICIGSVVTGLGAGIVLGAFEDPPNLGELPSLQAQLGGLLVGLGGLAVFIAGIRALFERKTRRLLEHLASARPALAREVRAGDLVAIFGRAEPDEAGYEAEPEEREPEALGAAEDDAQEPGDCSSFELPFGDRTTFYVHTDLGGPDGSLTRTTSFVVRDETGGVIVEPSQGQGLLAVQEVPIQGDVEQWLDRHDLEHGPSVAGDRRATMHVQRICEGDSVLIVGQASKAGRFRVVLRARGDDPLSLLFADLPLPEAIERLKRRPRATLALAAAGCLSIIAGTIALLA